MGRFTFYCPITGETQTFSNVPPGGNPTPYYSARCTKEEVDAFENAQRKLDKTFAPRFLRHPHQA